jgi:hypothetical protein
MGHQTNLLRYHEVDGPLGRAWDRLPPNRGLQADFEDSWAWLASWGHGVGRDAADRLRIALVGEGDAPLGLLPLVARTRHRWESAGTRRGFRGRWRPVLGTEEPDPEVLALLVEQVATAGARELVLHRLPTRDPATGALLGALRDNGFHVHQQEFSNDYTALVEGGWEEYRRRFASYERSVKRAVKNLRPVADLRLEKYGPLAEASAVDGFPLYAELFGRSWKGPLRRDMRAQELELVRRTEQLGWCRVFVLRIAGVAAAAELWFRVGDAASALSTVYDQRLAPLGPGSIIAWWAQERIFAETPPRLVDLLPGHNPQKDRLAPDRDPLLNVEAARRTLVSGASFPLRRRARAARRSAAGHVLAGIKRLRASLPSREARRMARTVTLSPAEASLPVVGLELDGWQRRLLAVAGGHRSPEAMAQTWPPDDHWWQIGQPPLALIRAGGPDPTTLQAHEVVLLQAGPDQLQELLAALAGALGARVQAALPASDGPSAPGQPIPVHQAPLPWPTPHPTPTP